MAKLVTSQPLGNSGSCEMMGTSNIFDTCKGASIIVFSPFTICASIAAHFFFVSSLIMSPFAVNIVREYKNKKKKRKEKTILIDRYLSLITLNNKSNAKSIVKNADRITV